jgi:hypothetical protein
MKVAHACLFNFSASPVGGGLKRLYEYAKWFDAHGGAWFMVHPRCERLREEFPRNTFFVVQQSTLARMVGDFGSVRRILKTLGTIPDCYYCYGIPLYWRVGRINWFHLSNVLPLAWRSVPLPLTLRLKFRLLHRRVVRGLPRADVISAESRASLDLFDPPYRERLFLSVNGSDDELAQVSAGLPAGRSHAAVVVGTYPHKDLDESCRVFEALRISDDRLELAVFGEERWIRRGLRGRPNVAIKGSRPRADVIDNLRRAKYYISTTRIENSYNAASEGIFLAEESYISDIGPHRELLQGLPHDRVMLPGVRQPMLHVERKSVTGAHLKTWNEVIVDMNDRIRTALDAARGSATP